LSGSTAASRWRAVSVSPLDGRPGYTLWGVADITRQHDMERMVHEEQDQLAEFLENAPIGFFSVDAEGRFLFVNETLASWLGHAPAEITGNGRALREFIAPPPTTAPPPLKERPIHRLTMPLTGAATYTCPAAPAGPSRPASARPSSTMKTVRSAPVRWCATSPPRTTGPRR
jgi:PAS domain-containing protein